MPLKATVTTAPDAYRIIRGAALNLRRGLQAANIKMSASGADFDNLRDWHALMVAVDAQIGSLKSTPGLNAFARIAEDDLMLDFVAQVNAVQGAVADAIAWMDATLPVSVTAKTPSQWIGGSTQIATTFTAGQTAGFRAELTAVIATIS